MKYIFLILFMLLGDIASSQDMNILKNYVPQNPMIYSGTRSVEGEFLPHGWIGNCTGTAVGPKAVFTAAHCVSNGKRINFKSRFDQKSYAATCYRHPKANRGSYWYSDYALCKLDGEFSADMVYASFSFRTPEVGEKLLPNGYGAPNVGTHYWGTANVRRYNGQDIVTCGPSNLGGGDSGGSLLAWSDDRSGKSGFDIVGVNSRGGGGCSYFNKINDNEFITWSKDQEQSRDFKLCGVSLDCKGGSDPIPPDAPESCWEAYDSFAFCIGSGDKACNSLIDKLKSCI